jgi:hypothetical protein
MPKVQYEWYLRECDSEGDVIDTMICSDYAGALSYAQQRPNTCDISCRKWYLNGEGDPLDGVSWPEADVRDGALADLFDDGTRVPKYLKNEVIKAHSTL